MHQIRINFLLVSFLAFSHAIINAQVETIITATDADELDGYGVAVNYDGDRTLIGARWNNDNGDDSGSAYIYEWDGSSWIETKILASDAAEDDNFGNSVSIDGDRCIVGAKFDQDNGFLSGSAYIYEWDGNSWIETKISASDGVTFDFFGMMVSISGDRCIVGAPSDLNGTGSAYIYEWDGSTWNETKLTASDASLGDGFGRSVSISGDRAIVGAYLDDDGGADSGSAYIYEWDGSSWVETKLTASDAASDDKFGLSVFIDGEQAIVGSFLDDDNGIDSGSAYIYKWDGSSWVETKITSSDASANDGFGRSVSTDGDRVLVGAFLDDDNGSNSGSAYIYEWDGSSWVETKITPSDGAYGDQFGVSVTINNDIAIVGSALNDDDGVNSGSAYLFDFFCPDGTPNNIYTDLGSGLWLDANNWSLNEIPSSCHRVIIPVGESVNIQAGEFAECYTIDVEEGALLELPQTAILNILVEE